MREVLARIQASIRRVEIVATWMPQNQIRTNDTISIDEQHHTVFVNTLPISLTNTEYKIITHMIKNSGKIITRQEFGHLLYGNDSVKIDRSIDMHIKNIRSKIEPDLENPIYILTVYGVGYRINENIKS